MKEIDIKDIVIDDLQARAATDEVTVADYAAAFEAGGAFPPVVVFHDGRDFYLADGFHRVLAAKRSSFDTIWADVHKGGRDDARWFSTGANAEHGLRRSAADKRRAVQIALSLKPDASSRAIADHCKVGHQLVEDVRRQLQPSSKPSTRTGKDGKCYKREPAASQDVKQPEKADEPGPAGFVDSIGRPVPEWIWPAWARADEVKAHLRALSSLRADVKRAMESEDAFWVGVNLSRAFADIGNAWREINNALPHAVCPICHGRESITKTCRMCYKKGFVSKFIWDRAVPEATREATIKMAKG